MLIVSSSALKTGDLSGLAVPPAWRKATRNMILATHSIDQALSRVPLLLERARKDLSLIIGTNSGEIETSAEFMVTLARTGMARPLLFQNSLHNATAGFASIHFGLSGPAFTLSDAEKTPQECVQLAQMLIDQKVCRAAIVTLVEVHKSMADYIGETVAEGACTLIFADPGLTQELGLAGRPVSSQLKHSSYKASAQSQPLYDITTSEFYDSAIAP